MSAREEHTRRNDVLFMLLHGGAATNSIARRVVDLAISEATAESAVEIASLRAQVAELEAERHSTNEALSAAVEELAKLRYLKPSPIQTCRVCGAGYTLGQPCSTCQFHELMDAARAEVQRQAEDPHDGPLHHDYAVPHDLPPYTPNVRGDR